MACKFLIICAVAAVVSQVALAQVPDLINQPPNTPGIHWKELKNKLQQVAFRALETATSNYKISLLAKKEPQNSDNAINKPLYDSIFQFLAIFYTVFGVLDAIYLIYDKYIKKLIFGKEKRP